MFWQVWSSTKRLSGQLSYEDLATPDGSVHVGEMEIDGALFHMHEETPKSNQLP